MKYFVLILAITSLSACISTKPQEGSNEATLEKLDSINSWYNRLVLKQLGPIYIFQTEPYNKDERIIHGNLFDYYLVEEGEEQGSFSSDFINWNFYIAKDYLDQKNLSYTKIYLQIPIKKEGFTHNLSSNAAKQGSIISKLTRQEFFFDNSIASLVDSKRYNPNFTISELPKELTMLIKERFEKVKTFLPENYRSKIIHSKLIISEPSADFDASKLFLNNFDGNVKISSVLVRAILVKAITQEALLLLDYAGSDFKLDIPVQLLNIPQLQARNQSGIDDLIALFYPQQPSRESTRKRFARVQKPKIETAYNNIIATINSTLDFLFLHEFSHIYLGPNMIDEFRADCYAYSPLKRQNSKIDYGVFRELMVTAIQNKGGHYWISNEDSLKLQEIVDRYDRVKKIDSLVNNEVLTIDLQCDKLDY
ncbi:hypothetical protein Aoki45_12620 [Algoriphagus sp. oki45]|uniref:hypothetical protein n=1 Tax=Algoriphagus sp. oki45 TaxID=3067294 RepID=UPI0027F0D1C9|nr:hypothetical protein Aoki45_12620 [Algoriphagus sp. oki45]